MVLACVYTYFIVPFSLAYEYDVTKWWLLIVDVLSLILFVMDIPISSRIAINKKYEVTLDTREIMADYLDSWLALDVIAILPVDYLLIPLGAS